MPFADNAGVIARRLQHLRNRHRLRVERDVIQKDTVRERPLPGQERRAHRRADRQARHGVNKLDTLALQPVKVGRLHVRVAREAAGLITPLVGKNEENVRRSLGSPQVELAGLGGEQHERD